MDEYLIYPKQLQQLNIPIEKNRCFVIMPFAEDLDFVYGIIKKGLNDNGYVCNRVDEIPGSTPIVNKILTELLRSRYIIADLTNCNPNVFYELGIAHSFKDAQNIIILKQKGSKVPFDITHLTYIEYDVDNPKYFVASILKNIKECSYLSDFHEALNIRGVISFVKENGDYFVEFLKAELQSYVTQLTWILMNETNRMSEVEIKLFIAKYENVISKAITKKDESILQGVLKIYQEILISCSALTIAQEHVLCFLDGTYFSKFNIHHKYIRSWETDMAIALANSQKMLTIVLPWIIRYFSETKTATIDLNRYKLEAFLMTSDHPMVDETICNSVFDANCYIREHMSDIIGEKHLEQGLPNLCKQLLCEENYYSAVSEIEAIGKLGKNSAIENIFQWISKNEEKIISEKQFFVLKHARIAIEKLDGSRRYISTFDDKYGELLNGYYIL